MRLIVRRVELAGQRRLREDEIPRVGLRPEEQHTGAGVAEVVLRHAQFVRPAVGHEGQPVFARQFRARLGHGIAVLIEAHARAGDQPVLRVGDAAGHRERLHPAHELRMGKLGVDDLGGTNQLAVVTSGRKVAGRAVVEIPAGHQPRLLPRERLEHAVANLLLRARAPPDAHVVNVTAERVRGRGIAPAEIIVRASQHGEAAGVVVRSHERAIEIKPPSLFARDGRHMSPLVEGGNSIHFHPVLGPCGVIDAEEQQGSIPRADIGVAGRASEVPRPHLVAGFLPLHPRLDGGLSQIGEEIRWQFHVAVRAGAVEHAADLRLHPVGIFRPLALDDRGTAVERRRMRARRQVASRLRGIIEIPIAHQPRLAARERGEHVRANLRRVARVIPDADLVHLALEIFVRRVAQAFPVGPPEQVALPARPQGRQGAGRSV